MKVKVEISQGMSEAVKAIERAKELPADQRRDYLEMLGHAATKYMRSIGGTEYVRGWLQAAMDELDRQPMVLPQGQQKH